jgi:alpha-glucoside transport system substrate-binding protein
VTDLRRRSRIVAAVGVLGLTLTGAVACGDSKSSTKDKNSAECAPFKDYQGHEGKKVTAYSSIRDVEADKLDQSWKLFEECTGIDIKHEGSGEFEAQIQVRSDGGNAPDLAFFPQPGLLQRFAAAGKLKQSAAATKAMAEKNFSKDWLGYGTVNGTLYAAPLGANVKSFVWYSPGLFKDKGYAVPTTWDEMIALSEKMTTVGGGFTPWCVGLESQDATGWPATDWMEDVILRMYGPDVYDQWVTHKIPFNDPRIVDAANKVGSIIKNNKYVGDPKREVTTSFQEGGLPVAQKKCGMHRQASFYANQWTQGTKVGENDTVFAFYFPPIDAAKGKPVLGGGEFVAAFADRPEVQAVQTYLASPEWATSRAKLGAWVSANKGVDISNFASPIDSLSVKLLQDPSTVFRFDGSDLMPGSVGAGTFWKEMINWVNGKDTKAALDAIEASWPKS